MHLANTVCIGVLSLSIIGSTSAIAQSLPPAQQSTPADQQAPQPNQNPATQANLPDAPSSLLAAKPHEEIKPPLEDIPHPPVAIMQVPLNIIGDTYRIFTSPIYLRPGDLKWLLPVAAATGVAFTQDSHVARDVVSHNPDFNTAADTVSYDLEYSYFAGSAVMYGVGAIGHNDHLRETGLLSGEAEVDAQIFAEVIKLASFRERPDTTNNNYAGKFFQTSAGTDSSFVSGHALTTWSAAAVIAAEYPSPWKQAAVYAGAAGTSLSRVLAEKHFPSDVLLGSVAGWMIGHYVVRAHHHFPIYRHHGNQPSF